MTKKLQSPFAAMRYEHDGNHVYYLPPAVLELFERAIPTLLVGTRGTGKTTLLKALSWDERLDNVWLQKQLQGDPFAGSYIGLYFKLPNVQLALLDRWLQDAHDSDYAAVFAFYLDLCWLETVAPALKHLVAARKITLAEDHEREFISELDEIWSAYPSLDIMFGNMPTTVQSFLSLMHPMRRSIEKFARQSADHAEVIEVLPVGQIGSFGRLVGRLLSQLLDKGAGAEQHLWSFRVCMDEGEALTLRQQRVINSMIRLAEWPVFYVVAYVSRPPDVAGTFLPNQTLQAADRQIHVLDTMKDADFKALAEGVVNVRLDAMECQTEFDAYHLLGKLDLNALLLKALRQSEGDFAPNLIQAARASDPDAKVPPIYETYLRAERPQAAQRPEGRRAVRKMSSASIRKHNVAAYLSICKRAKTDPWYASADMVLRMSDNCIRDFLRQMEFIFVASERELEEFLKSRLTNEIQHAGIRSAARLKMTLFRERIVASPTEANQLVDGLAQVTAEIQSSGRNGEQLSTPERGIFRYISRTDASGTMSRNEILIRDAAEAGFLRLLPNEASDDLRFRVHASLAPQYGFSYRGAYYDAVVLSDVEVDAFRFSRTHGDRNRAVAAVTSRLGGRRGKLDAAGGQQTLTGLEES